MVAIVFAAGSIAYVKAADKYSDMYMPSKYERIFELSPSHAVACIAALSSPEGASISVRENSGFIYTPADCTDITDYLGLPCANNAKILFQGDNWGNQKRKISFILEYERTDYRTIFKLPFENLCTKLGKPRFTQRGDGMKYAEWQLPDSRILYFGGGMMQDGGAWLLYSIRKE